MKNKFSNKRKYGKFYVKGLISILQHRMIYVIVVTIPPQYYSISLKINVLLISFNIERHVIIPCVSTVLNILQKIGHLNKIIVNVYKISYILS